MTKKQAYALFPGGLKQLAEYASMTTVAISNWPKDLTGRYKVIVLGAIEVYNHENDQKIVVPEEWKNES